MLLLGGEPAHRAEAGQDQRVHARLGAAREHGVGVAAPDQLGGLADRVRAGRAGRHDRVVRPADARARSPAARSPSRRARSAGSTATPGRARAPAAPRAAPSSRGSRRSPSRRRCRPAPGRSRSGPRPRAPPAPRASASRTLRSSLRASFGETTVGGSKSFTSAAIRTGKLARVERADEVDAALARDGGLPRRRERRCRSA